MLYDKIKLFMRYQDIKLTLYLKDLWAKAYEGDVFVIDYTDLPEAIYRTTSFYIALANYRRHVRIRKLNPLYKDEWSRIERCRLMRVSPTVFALARKNNHIFKNKRAGQLSKLPWNSLALPKSVIYL
jgi:hypothetical protein